MTLEHHMGPALLSHSLPLSDLSIMKFTQRVLRMCVPFAENKIPAAKRPELLSRLASALEACKMMVTGARD
jgi:hypothetical protein